jgi:hypothetical protein
MARTTMVGHSPRGSRDHPWQCDGPHTQQGRWVRWVMQQTHMVSSTRGRRLDCGDDDVRTSSPLSASTACRIAAEVGFRASSTKRQSVQTSASTRRTASASATHIHLTMSECSFTRVASRLARGKLRIGATRRDGGDLGTRYQRRTKVEREARGGDTKRRVCDAVIPPLTFWRELEQPQFPLHLEKQFACQ